MEKLNTETFIKKAKEKHGNYYNYSKVNYINSTTKVCIICPEHGEFWQKPVYHLQGSICPLCAEKNRHIKKRKSEEAFIEEAIKIHNGKYDYSKVKYKGYQEKVCIICPEHGEFWQSPDSHISQKHGCPLCGGTKKLTQEEFITRARLKFDGKYDYTKVDYKNITTKVCIICPEHGEFWQSPLSHLENNGCPKCSRCYMDNDYFKERGTEVHHAKYIYDKVDYINSTTKVCIICPEHGEFWQSPGRHLMGDGCPICKSSKMEMVIKNYLSEKNINFEYEKQFPWLKNKRKMHLDFFLPDYNVGIECQGSHHFKPVYYSARNLSLYERNFKEGIKRDALKKELCEKNNVFLEYINYNENIIEKIEKILKEYATNQK